MNPTLGLRIRTSNFKSESCRGAPANLTFLHRELLARNTQQRNERSLKSQATTLTTELQLATGRHPLRYLIPSSSRYRFLVPIYTRFMASTARLAFRVSRGSRSTISPPCVYCSVCGSTSLIVPVQPLASHERTSGLQDMYRHQRGRF